MQSSVRQQTPRESLYASARRLLPALRALGERYCLITPPVGQSQVRAVAAYVAQSGSVTVYKVAMLPAIASSAHASTEQDCAWCVIDHSHKAVLFGPVDGIQVSEEDRGVATYLIGQLIRLLKSKNEPSGYRVIEIDFPSKPDDDGALASWEKSTRKATVILENQGFRVSRTAGGIVANVQRLGNLIERWNSDKISYVPSTRLMYLYNEAVRAQAECHDRIDELHERNQVLDSEVARLNEASQELTDLKASAERQEEKIRSLVEQISILQPYQTEVRSLREELEAARDNLCTDSSRMAEGMSEDVHETQSTNDAIGPSFHRTLDDEHRQPASPQPPSTVEHTHKLVLGSFERWTLALAAAALVVAVGVGALKPLVH